MATRTPGRRWLLGELRRQASWMRLLVREGAEIARLPAILERVRSNASDEREPGSPLGASLKLAMEAEELPAFVDWVAEQVESQEPPRLDLVVRLRDLLDVRRPTRKAHLAPVDGVVTLEAADGYTRLALRVPYIQGGAFPVVLTLDDEVLVEDGATVPAGTKLCEGEIYLPDLLQISGPESVVRAFEVHLTTIAEHLGCTAPAQLPDALSFVRNWMLGWVCVLDPGGLPVPGGTILPGVLVEDLVKRLEPGDARPRLQRQLIGLSRLAERYLGGISAETW